jgi:hypothetical protein
VQVAVPPAYLEKSTSYLTIAGTGNQKADKIKNFFF